MNCWISELRWQIHDLLSQIKTLVIELLCYLHALLVFFGARTHGASSRLLLFSGYELALQCRGLNGQTPDKMRQDQVRTCIQSEDLNRSFATLFRAVGKREIVRALLGIPAGAQALPRTTHKLNTGDTFQKKGELLAAARYFSLLSGLRGRHGGSSGRVAPSCDADALVAFAVSIQDVAYRLIWGDISRRIGDVRQISADDKDTVSFVLLSCVNKRSKPIETTGKEEPCWASIPKSVVRQRRKQIPRVALEQHFPAGASE